MRMTMKQTTLEADLAGFVDNMLSVTLHNGYRIPNLGFSTALSDDVQKDIRQALASGYRHVTVDASRQKDLDVGRSIGKAVRDGGLERRELFVTLQVELDKDLTKENAPQQVKQRLRTVGCEYFDMVVLKIPSHIQSRMSGSVRSSNRLLGIWRGLEKAVDAGHARCIGCSNLCRDDVETIVSSANKQPAALWLDNLSLVSTLGEITDHKMYCKYRGIHPGVQVSLDSRRLEAGLGVKARGVLTSLAKQHKRSPLQLLQRYLLQQGILSTAASIPDLARESFQVLDFFLGKEDMEAILEIHA